MDIEKLNAVCFGILCNFAPTCGEKRAKEAADLVRSLQAENKKLRADLEQKSKLIAQQAKELERRDKLLKEQEDELERVKQKYNEAREAICTHCMDVPCREENCYWWRCPKKEG